MKNIINICLISTAVVFFACKDTKELVNPAKTKDNLRVNNKVEVKDFSKIEGVNNVNNVPFELMSQLDSVQFFVEPDHKAARLKIVNNKFNNYYGFEERGDFYAIHFSIDNVLSNSIEAFVLKSEFNKKSELTLNNINLDEIRYSTHKDQTDDINKSFAKFGHIVEVSLQEYNDAKTRNKAERFTKNSEIILDGNFWKSKIHSTFNFQKVETTEEGTIDYQYIGKSNVLNQELFLEKVDFTSLNYYAFLNPNNAAKTMLTPGFPHILADGRYIFSLSKSDDVGSYLSISNFQNEQQNQLLFINFTNFSVPDSQKVILIDKNTLYAEVVPSNSAEVNGVQKKSYIKITLKKDLF